MERCLAGPLDKEDDAVLACAIDDEMRELLRQLLLNPAFDDADRITLVEEVFAPEYSVSLQNA